MATKPKFSKVKDYGFGDGYFYNPYTVGSSGILNFSAGEDVFWQDLYKHIQSTSTAGAALEWLGNLTEQERANFLDDDAYWSKNGRSYDYDVDALLADLTQLSEFSGSIPQEPDYKSIRDSAGSTIDAENEKLFSLLDEESASNKAMYQGQMRDLNDQYGNVSSNILSQNYQQNAALTDSVQSEMSKSKRNALEAGASAGMRLASNINTLMSTQNQQNANAMQTSNNLAQMMLQQRQAAQGLQGDYSNYMNNVGQQRRRIIGGTAERKNSYARDSIDTEKDIYDQEMNTWENKYNSATRGNPLSEYYRTHLTTSQYN